MTTVASHPVRLLGLPLLATAFATLPAPVFCQTAASAPQNTSPKSFAYEAVTVKPDSPNNAFMKFTPDSFSMSGMPMVMLIRTAYGVLMDDQIVGLPGWASSEPMQIQAKMDPETAAALGKLPPMEHWKESRRMLQELLADRFGLKTHHASKDLPIYVLTVAKSGSKVKKITNDAGGGNASYGSGNISAHAVPMENFATNLSFTVGRVVVNKTGLEGGYDFTLEFAPEGADASDPRPSIFTALEEQLGLKLVPAKGPVDVIVIDRIERPSEN